MLAAIAEELILQRAVVLGLISLQDLTVATADRATSAPLRFGPKLDALIENGRLSVEAVEKLCAELAQEPAARIGNDQTVASSGANGGPALESDHVGHAETQASMAARQPTAVSGSTGFPVQSWDKYEFLGLLGRGGMGAVYRARDRRLDRIVALKFIHGENPAQVQRFIQEARAQARLDHPNICKVFEVGVVDGKPYIAMQLVHGLPLDRASRAMSLLEKVQICKDVAEAMHVAHEQGIIHRDLKPSNILVGRSALPDGTVRYEPVVMDFGLARDSSGGGLTESGDVFGTPAYMSPEQARGETRRMDRRTDVYSLGATLYDVLVGRPPFDDQTVVNIILRVINEAPQPMRSISAELPEALELIVQKCLNKEAEQRYPTAKALADDLGRFLSARRVEARRLGYGYRLGYFARRNKALFTVGVGLFASLLGFLIFGAYTRVLALRKERLAKEETALAQKLGQSVKDLEWLVRTAYLLPLHDTRREKLLVRERMDEITADLKRTGSASAERLGAYVLGRGHLALHDLDAAQRQLARAAELGYRDPELDFAMGRVLGERYSRAVEEARKSGDKGFFEKRRKELEAELLVPARVHLRSARTLRTVSTSYIEALIDFYNQHYDAALLNAEMAQVQEPWLYEARKLQGDVHMSRALEARDHGDSTQAERHFADAIARYEGAAAIGHSDPQVHEAIAEAWIRQEEMDMYRGVNPEAKFRQAIAAADRAFEAAPTDSYAYTKKAFATYFMAQYVHFHDNPKNATSLYQQQADFGETAIRMHPEDAYAHEVAGLAYKWQAEITRQSSLGIEGLLKKSYDHFEKALQIYPNFAWAYNDYGSALSVAVDWMVARSQDPDILIQKQIEVTRRAVEIDSEYLFARINLSAAYYYMSKWNIEHGISPEKATRAGITETKAALRLNDKLAPIYGNLGFFYNILSLYAIDKNVPDYVSAQNAIDNYQQAIHFDGAAVDSYRYLGLAHFLMASQQHLAHEDPTEAIQRGLAAVDGCYRIAAQQPDCQGVEAQLRMLLADWNRSQDRSFLRMLDEAQKLAQQATRQQRDNEALLLILGEICLRQATAQWARKQLSMAQVQEGVAALDRAVDLASGWPRALALRGALFVLRGRMETGDVRRRSFEQARRSLSEGLERNALLRNRFEGWLKEAEQGALPQ